MRAHDKLFPVYLGHARAYDKEISAPARLGQAYYQSAHSYSGILRRKKESHWQIQIIQSHNKIRMDYYWSRTSQKQPKTSKQGQPLPQEKWHSLKFNFKLQYSLHFCMIKGWPSLSKY